MVAVAGSLLTFASLVDSSMLPHNKVRLPLLPDFTLLYTVPFLSPGCQPIAEIGLLIKHLSILPDLSLLSFISVHGSSHGCKLNDPNSFGLIMEEMNQTHSSKSLYPLWSRGNRLFWKEPQQGITPLCQAWTLLFMGDYAQVSVT